MKTLEGDTENNPKWVQSFEPVNPGEDSTFLRSYSQNTKPSLTFTDACESSFKRNWSSSFQRGFGAV